MTGKAIYSGLQCMIRPWSFSTGLRGPPLPVFPVNEHMTSYWSHDAELFLRSEGSEWTE